jgi:hypothetical protein
VDMASLSTGLIVSARDEKEDGVVDAGVSAELHVISTRGGRRVNGVAGESCSG